MTRFELLTLAFSVASCSCSANPPTKDITVPITKPAGATVVPKDFVGFGIESAFIIDYANDFSENLVNSLADRMSKPPVIRVGGTSGDYLMYNPAQKEARVCRAEPCQNSRGKFNVGPSFFKSYQRFKNAHTTIQAPLENPINRTNTVGFVREAWKNLDDGKRAAAIALGNEVGYIYKMGAKSYVNAALELQQSIVKSLGLSGGAAKIFEAGNTASGQITDNKGYNIADILKAGINKNGLISTTAEHWYQVGHRDTWNDSVMQRLITNHSAIAERFTKYAVSLKASQRKGIPYIINEDAAVLGGAPVSFASSFGYALWAVDFNLLAMSRGISRVNNLAGSPTAKRSFWVPKKAGKNSGPGVRAPYPSAIFVADFIGKGNSTAVTELNTNNELLSAYAMYNNESGKLERLALVNMRLYNGKKEQRRGKVTFRVRLDKSVKSAKLRRLHAGEGVAAMGFDFGGPSGNVSWAGQQWSHSVDQGKGHYTSGKMEESVVEVKDGVALVDVPDSEAVMVLAS